MKCDINAYFFGICNTCLFKTFKKYQRKVQEIITVKLMCCCCWGGLCVIQGSLGTHEWYDFTDTTFYPGAWGGVSPSNVQLLSVPDPSGASSDGQSAPYGNQIF